MPTNPAAWARSTLLVLLAPIASLALADQAHACPWDWETYYAEQRSLPCVYDALLGYWPKHTDEYHRTRIEAADHHAAFDAGAARTLRDLFDIVRELPTTEVQVDGKKTPYGHELWLPLFWFFVGGEA